MALSIPPDYGRKVASGRPTTMQIVADGTDSNSTGVAMGYAQALIGGYVQDLAAAAAPGAAGRRRWCSRRSASGSTRGSKAATS